MTPRLQVSEKTLEINLCAELLIFLRGLGSQFSKAHWIGLKQAEEKASGLDDVLRGIKPGYYLALQFKAPQPPSVKDPYLYPLNVRQLDRLRRLARRRPRAVLYALPHINTLDALRDAVPRLLAKTRALPVCDVPSLSGPARTHHVFSNEKTWAIRSDPIVFSEPLRLLTDSLRLALEDDWRSQMLGDTDIREWITETHPANGNIRDSESRAAFGQQMRGFGFMQIPT